MTDFQREFFLKKIQNLKFLNDNISILNPQLENILLNDFESLVGFIPYFKSEIFLQSPLYRLVINKYIRDDKLNKRLLNIEQIKYPPEKIKNKIYYNRANIKCVPTFYGSFGYQLTVALETNPQVGDLFTESEWIQKENTSLIYISIFHTEEIASASNQFTEDWKHYLQLLNSINQNTAIVIKELYTLVTDVFTKPVNPNNKIEYILSALFANHFLYHSDCNVDCIIYPSVPSDYCAHNVALKPKILEEKFELKSLVEDFCFYTGSNKKQ